VSLRLICAPRADDEQILDQALRHLGGRVLGRLS
jgi:hypothetical protein